MTKREMYISSEFPITKYNWGFICHTSDLSAVCFVGKKTKPSFNYRFTSVEHKFKYINDFVEKEQKKIVDKQKQKELIDSYKVSDVLKIGDVLYSSWGYEQTNIDYYQVIGIKNKQVIIQEIGKEYKEDSNLSMSGYSVPMVGDFKGEPITKKVSFFSDGKIYIKISSFQTAWILDKVEVTKNIFVYEKKHESHYA